MNVEVDGPSKETHLLATLLRKLVEKVRRGDKGFVDGSKELVNVG